MLKGPYELLFIPSIFTSFRYPLLQLNWSINCSLKKLYINCFIPLCSYCLVSREYILFLAYLWAPTNPARLSSIFLEIFYHPTNQNQLFHPLCSSLWTCCVYHYYLHRPLSLLLVFNQFIHSSTHPFIPKLFLKCLMALCKEMGMWWEAENKYDACALGAYSLQPGMGRKGAVKPTELKPQLQIRAREIERSVYLCLSRL